MSIGIPNLIFNGNMQRLEDTYFLLLSAILPVYTDVYLSCDGHSISSYNWINIVLNVIRPNYLSNGNIYLVIIAYFLWELYKGHKLQDTQFEWHNRYAQQVIQWYLVGELVRQFSAFINNVGFIFVYHSLTSLS